MRGRTSARAPPLLWLHSPCPLLLLLSLLLLLLLPLLPLLSLLCLCH